MTYLRGFFRINNLSIQWLVSVHRMNIALDVHAVNALRDHPEPHGAAMDRLLDTEHENERIVLGLLNSVEHDGDRSQRHIAAELGIALGLVNAYLKRCVKKGLVKVHDAPARRYAYYLTPQGFAEKSRLTVQYLSHSFRSFAWPRRSARKRSRLRRPTASIGWCWLENPILPRSQFSAR